MEETPEARTVEVKGEAEEEGAAAGEEEVPWQEAEGPVASADSRTSEGEGRTRCSSRDEDVQNSFEAECDDNQYSTSHPLCRKVLKMRI